jgi:uncharacterized protein YecE (DUF72 family)
MLCPVGGIYIGISGWRYPPWRGVFYPPGLAQHRELAWAASVLPTIEINGSFYSLQTPRSYADWYAETPPGFVFGVKGGRYITHVRRLRDVERPLANFFASGVFNLREKLGPFLWQFPPQLRYDPGRFEDFFALLPRDAEAALALARRRDHRMTGRARLAIDANRRLRHAVEIRHESFVDERFLAQLRRHRVALVVADTAGKWPCLEEPTSDFMYLRLHGDKELYASGYGDVALERWAAKIRAWSRRGAVYCYFDNDVKVRAPFDARRLIEKLGLADAGERGWAEGRRRLRGAKIEKLALPPLRWDFGRKRA